MLLFRIRTLKSFSILSPSIYRRDNKKSFLKVSLNREQFRFKSTTNGSNSKVFLYNSLIDDSVSVDKSSNDDAGLIPITLLSGFLGSGKTTTLKHLLENSDNVRIGAVVNDVASVNIDSKLISSLKEGVSNTVELQNGCACCSLADELLESVEGLINGRKLDEVVVELSGVADPAAVKANWESAVAMGHPATKLASLKRIVTLIDGCTFGSDFMSYSTAGERDGWTDDVDECAAERKISELLAEQVEAADVLLINKMDLATEEQTQVTSNVAKGMNKNALLLEIDHGRVKPEDIFTINQINPTNAHTRKSTSTTNLGISSFVYKATRPFHLQRLLALLSAWPVPIKEELDLSLLNQAIDKDVDSNIFAMDSDSSSPFIGVLRSKGFCWIAPTAFLTSSASEDDSWRHETAMYWSLAGRHFGISAAGQWWDTVSKEQMKSFFSTNLEEYNRILNKDFVSDEFGDRRQELVFIGMGLNKENVYDELNSCLLNDDEMNMYRTVLRLMMEVNEGTTDSKDPVTSM